MWQAAFSLWFPVLQFSVPMLTRLRKHQWLVNLKLPKASLCITHFNQPRCFCTGKYRGKLKWWQVQPLLYLLIVQKWSSGHLSARVRTKIPFHLRNGRCRCRRRGIWRIIIGDHFKKSRTLSLSLIDYQLAENRSTEFTIGMNWRKKGMPFFKNGLRIFGKDIKMDNDVTFRWLQPAGWCNGQ